MQEFNASPVDAIVRGRQLTIVGSGVVPDTDATLAVALIARALPASGTYYFPLPVTGASAIDVILRLSAHTGTVPTASIYKTLLDGTTEKMDSAGASEAVAFSAFVDGSQRKASITTLRGEKVVMLKIVVPGASTSTFDQGEYSSL